MLTSKEVFPSTTQQNLTGHTVGTTIINMSAFLKSLLYFHVHGLAVFGAAIALNTLFYTWHLPFFSFTCSWWRRIFRQKTRSAISYVSKIFVVLDFSMWEQTRRWPYFTTHTNVRGVSIRHARVIPFLGDALERHLSEVNPTKAGRIRATGRLSIICFLSLWANQTRIASVREISRITLVPCPFLSPLVPYLSPFRKRGCSNGW